MGEPDHNEIPQKKLNWNLLFDLEFWREKTRSRALFSNVEKFIFLVQTGISDHFRR